MLAVLAVVAIALPAAAPSIERRHVNVECEPGDAGRCRLAKADLLSIMGASEALMRENERLKRECPPPTDVAPGSREIERRT